MSVLDSEDEMEELGREVLEVAKVLYLHPVGIIIFRIHNPLHGS